MQNPFMLGIAHGSSFCNRTKEKTLLCNNMRSTIHTVVYAPRRYGKSSLAAEIREQLTDMVCVYVDLFSVTSAEDVAEKIYRAIVIELGRKAADTSSLASRILASFKNLRLRIEFNSTNSIPEFGIFLGDDSAELHLENIITSLDQYCSAQSIKVCLMLDEFQEICGLRESKKIEAFLRGGMQLAQNVSFLIMGSRRTILRDMFEDRKRPFYKSAYVLQLQQIPLAEFAAFLVSRYQAFGKKLSLEDAEGIVTFVDAYPYYVQKLAMLHFDLPNEGNDSLNEARKLLIEMEAADFEGIYMGLTNHQKRLLRATAKLKPESIFGGAFLMAARLGSQGGVQTSLAKLKKMDLVEFRGDVWRVVDPVFEKWLIGQ